MLTRIALVLLPLAGLAFTFAPAADPPEEFESAQLYFEQNVTDGDAELVCIALGGDDGLRKLDVVDPTGKKITSLKAKKSTLGVREFAFESPEPLAAEVFATYPEGTYTLKGTGLDGTKFVSEIELSQVMPTAPNITSPVADDPAVDLATLVVEWEPVVGAQHYVLEMDQELVDLEFELRIVLPAATTSFVPPAGWLQPGFEAAVSVFTVGANGNISASEVSFTGV